MLKKSIISKSAVSVLTDHSSAAANSMSIAEHSLYIVTSCADLLSATTFNKIIKKIIEYLSISIELAVITKLPKNSCPAHKHISVVCAKSTKSVIFIIAKFCDSNVGL